MRPYDGPFLLETACFFGDRLVALPNESCLKSTFLMACTRFGFGRSLGLFG